MTELTDDGLALPEVGAWSETKYRLIAYYAQKFSKAMRGKWGTRVYVDLFAGAGRGRVKGSKRIVATSALLALGVEHPFDRYVLCELDPEQAAALELRVARISPSAHAQVVHGDCNERVDQILGAIPRGRRGAGVLSFCVADPFKLANLRFATIELLAERYLDFMILVPSYMDAHRNLRPYLAARSNTVADFLGVSGWREDWSEARRGRGSSGFGAFIVDRLGRRMKDLGFLYNGPSDTVTVKDRGRVLYHLTFFSRHPTGRKFWDQARHYSSPQLDLDFEGGLGA